MALIGDSETAYERKEEAKVQGLFRQFLFLKKLGINQVEVREARVSRISAETLRFNPEAERLVSHWGFEGAKLVKYYCPAFLLDAQGNILWQVGKVGVSLRGIFQGFPLWMDFRSETVLQAIERIGGAAEMIGYLVVCDKWDRLTVYKTPKGLTIPAFIKRCDEEFRKKQQQSRTEAELESQRELEQIDAED